MDNQAHYRIHISKLNEVYLKVTCDNPDHMLRTSTVFYF